MKKKSWCGWPILLVLLLVPGLALSQAVQQSRTLIVNGQPGQVKVTEIDGRSYVDLESLVRIANGTLGFRGNQITLTLPSSAAGKARWSTPSRTITRSRKTGWRVTAAGPPPASDWRP
jgi:hypothetical protein